MCLPGDGKEDQLTNRKWNKRVRVWCHGGGGEGNGLPGSQGLTVVWQDRHCNFTVMHCTDLKEKSLRRKERHLESGIGEEATLPQMRFNPILGTVFQGC